MADFREPPPLFDDEDINRKDEDNDIFASAVQSPMSEDATSSAVQVKASSHPLLEPSASEGEVNEDRAIMSPSNIAEVKTENPDLFEPYVEKVLNDNLTEVSLNIETQAMDQVSSSIGNNCGGGVNSKLIATNEMLEETISIPKVNLDLCDLLETYQYSDSLPSEEEVMQAFSNPSHIISDLDTTEILLDDNAQAQEISLRDEEFDSDLFQSAIVETHPAKQITNSSLVNSLPPTGEQMSEPHQAPVISTSYSVASATSAATSPMSPVASFGNKLTSPLEQIEKESGDTFISISISDPQKIGDGMGSYMAYKLTTNTSIPYFRKKNWSVTRRFSDFLGLHSKLVEKHLHSGVIIPPAPEKAAIATTKIKLGSDKNSDFSSVEFIEKRRAALERYMNRTASHPKLRTDPDFREFIELDTELPKATQTSAISGAGVLRLFNRVGETVNKMAFKMDESDQWFEEKTQQIESLDNQLRKLHAAMEGLVGYRRELANATGSFANSAAILSSVEEHSALSRALHQLSEATDRVHTIHHSQADADFYHLSETTKDYINIIGAVKEVFHERVKTYQTWQHAIATLAKKRENKAKTELTGRIDKVEQANEEVREWEVKVERSQEEFDRISKAIKIEMEQFDVIRVVDFKEMLIKYLESLITSQLQIVKVWETFLPEAKAIA